MPRVLIQMVCFVCLAVLTSVEVHWKAWAFAVFCGFMTLMTWGFLLIEALLPRLKERQPSGAAEPGS